MIDKTQTDHPVTMSLDPVPGPVDASLILSEGVNYTRSRCTNLDNFDPVVREAFGRGVAAQKIRPQSATRGRVASRSRALAGDGVDVCAAAHLVHGEKIAIDVGDHALGLVRTASGAVRVWSRRRPHVGVDLMESGRSNRRLQCPDHGLAFDLETGLSPFAYLRPERFEALEQGGGIRVSKAVQGVEAIK